jgi:hypothetical protein
LGFHSSSIDIGIEQDERVPDGEKDERTQSDNGVGEKGGVDVDGQRNRGWTVDVPMRSFQGGYYPKLIALYRHLGIPLVSTHYTFSFARLYYGSTSSSATTPNQITKPSRPHFIHSGASGQSIPSLPSSAFKSPLALITSLLTLIAYAGCYLLLLALAFLSYHDLLPTLFSGSLSDFNNQIASFLYHPIPIPYLPLYTPLGRVWRSFISDIVIPLFSSVGTMPEDEVYRTPVKVLLEYIHKTVGTDHYTPAPGHSARTIAEKLVESVREQGVGYLRTGNRVAGLRYENGEVVVRLATQSEGQGSGNGEEIRVDRVVLATPASVTANLLGLLGESLDSQERDSAAELETERVRMMRRALKGVRYKVSILLQILVVQIRLAISR